MPKDPATGLWIPDADQVVKLFDTPDGPHLVSRKQLEIMQACREPNGHQKLLFVEGPKFSGKTKGCLEAIPDHLWNVKNARVSVVTTSIGTGDDGGVWSELTEKIIPEWISGDFGFDWWMKGPRARAGVKIKGGSKKNYIEVTNKFGGRSYAELDSLKEERLAERVFFGRLFTMVYLPEVQLYLESRTFKALAQTLRVPNVPDENFVFLCDGNPSDKGTRSWQYALWWTFKSNTNIPEDEQPMQRNLSRIHVSLEDNPFLSPERKGEIRATYRDDVNLYKRYVLGEWVEASEDALFLDVYKPAIHVIGDSGERDPEVLVPTELASTLYTSWDFGPTNPAVVFFEQVFPNEWKAGEDENGNRRPLSQFRFFGEIVYLEVVGEFTLADFTALVLEKMAYWENFLGHPVQWTHFSDRSVLDTRDPIANQLQHTEVLSVSDGKIDLIAVDRRPGSVSAAVRLWRRLLAQHRLLFSSDCVNLIAAQTGLTPARNSLGVIPYSVARGNRHRHVFDAARYGIVSLCWEEMMDSLNDARTKKRSETERVLSVAL